jgi:hypothetical protein
MFLKNLRNIIARICAIIMSWAGCCADIATHFLQITVL